MKPSSLIRTVILLSSCLFFGIVFFIGYACDALTANFWVNYIFLLNIAAGTFILTFVKSSRNGTYLPFVFQYAKAVIIYVAYIVTVSLSLMFIKGLPWVVPLVVHFVSLVVFAIVLASSSMGIAHVKTVHDKQTAEVQYLITLETKLCEARDLCETQENKAAFDKIIRAVQNSSYRSFPEVRSIELELLNMADELQGLDGEEQAATLKQIGVLLNKRSNTISMLRR